LLIALMATGTFTTARIGTMTFGAAHDIFSAAIAISQIKLGLPGRLAYREVVQAISNVLMDGKSAWVMPDAADAVRARDPATITQSFRAAVAVKQADVEIPATRAGYLTDWAEDVGYAEFYDLAFRVFGFNAFSTHKLYMAILTASTLLFGLAFYKDNAAMGTLALVISALFLTSAAGTFSALLPSFAANRFLSTLALVPLLHIIHAALRSGSIRAGEIAALMGQIVLLVMASSFRSSANWTLAAISLSLLAILYLRRDRSQPRYPKGGGLGQTAAALWRTPGFGRLAAVGGLVILVTAEVGFVRYQQFDERYFWDDNLPHHLVWHSAYVGLGANPDWPLVKPFPDVPNWGDGAPFTVFQHHNAALGLPVISTRGDSPAWALARSYEEFTRHEYLSFLVDHPLYTAELFFYYKPVGLLSLLMANAVALADHHLLVNLLAIIIAISLATALFSLVGRGRELIALAAVSGIIWLCSLLPIMWAYPTNFTIADQIWSAAFLLLAMVCVSGAALRRRAAPGWMGRPRQGMPPARPR
jgi:hypothetical protein